LGDEPGFPNQLWPVTTLFNINLNQNPAQGEITNFVSHPLFTGVTRISFWTKGGSLVLTSGAAQAVAYGTDKAAVVAISEQYRGRMVAIGDTNFFDNRALWNFDNNKFAMNVFGWLSFQIK
jgi:hypothetical protein